MFRRLCVCHFPLNTRASYSDCFVKLKGRGVTAKFYREKVLKNLNSTTVNAGQRVELRIFNFSTTSLLHTNQVL